MADTDPPPETPDPVVTDENLLHCPHWCLTLVARLPVHYEEYIEIVSNFDAQNIPYEEFRFQMVALLLQNSNYTHLRVYWDVFDRVIIGEKQMLQDNPLFLHPVALYILLNLFLYSEQIRDPLWNEEQERILASQSELSRIRSRRYRMAGGDPIRTLDPDKNPEWNLIVLLDWFQDSRSVVRGSSWEVNTTTVTPGSCSINVTGKCLMTSIWRKWERCCGVGSTNFCACGGTFTEWMFVE